MMQRAKNLVIIMPEENDVKAEKKVKAKEKKQYAAKPKKEAPLASYAKMEDPFSVLRHVHMTEKAVRAIELQNQLVFIVRNSATKKTVRDAAEAAFSERVADVRTLVDQKGRKKAFIRFAKEGVAGEIAIKLGII